MGNLNVIPANETAKVRRYMQFLFKDIDGLAQMIAGKMIEEGVTRIGAEQELCLVDKTLRPAPVADEVLSMIDDDHFTNELSKFNLEINLDPLRFEGDCLSMMEKQLSSYLALLQEKVNLLDSDYMLVGILPTIRSSDLEIENMTPQVRYYALNDAIVRMRGGPQDFRIQGTDELITRHNSVMFESCNTSFQVHYQVGASNFVNAYNCAQAISGPVLAACTNSPLFLGKRLWRETRIALFRQSTDTRGEVNELRESKSRVVFGDDWINDNILDIVKEDITMHRPLVISEELEDTGEQLERNEIPRLKALALYNGTIYKWNRACYGISEGKPHLRIENRYLPAGPTIPDEITNTAFWVGLMHGLPAVYENVAEKLEFYVAKSNFIKAARVGLASKFDWIGGKRYFAEDLILNELLPIAREGLAKAAISNRDIDRYLGILEERVKTGNTGSQWIIDSFNTLSKNESLDASLVATTAGILNRQKKNQPVHLWDSVHINEAGGGVNRYRRIDQIMSRKLYTVQDEDLVDLVPNIMMWKQIRHLLVENDKGELVGLVTMGRLGQHYSVHDKKEKKAVPVKNIMVNDVYTVKRDTLTVEALALMREKKIGCLPVVNEDNKLVGIVTERDFLKVAEFFLDESK